VPQGITDGVPLLSRFERRGRDSPPLIHPPERWALLNAAGKRGPLLFSSLRLEVFSNDSATGGWFFQILFELSGKYFRETLFRAPGPASSAYHQSDGVIAVGDKLKFEVRVFPGERGHIPATSPGKRSTRNPLYVTAKLCRMLAPARWLTCHRIPRGVEESLPLASAILQTGRVARFSKRRKSGSACP
jgi:hypothetical protein